MTETIDTRTPRARVLAARRNREAAEPETKPAADPVLPVDPTLAAVGVPTKYHDELVGARITTLSALEAFGDLTAIKGIGPKGAEEIQAALAAYREQQSKDDDA